MFCLNIQHIASRLLGSLQNHAHVSDFMQLTNYAEA